MRKKHILLRSVQPAFTDWIMAGKVARLAKTKKLRKCASNSNFFFPSNLINKIIGHIGRVRPIRRASSALSCLLAAKGQLVLLHCNDG
jgi:hypothetical protein